MLTGDNEVTAGVIGRLVNVDEIRADLLPQDKVTAVEALAAQYGQVAMVGDGINDAPALAEPRSASPWARWAAPPRWRRPMSP